MAKSKKKSKKISVLSVIILILLVAGYLYYNYVYLPKKNKDFYGKEIIYDYAENELTFHFPVLGNKYNGDCIYIKAGENDILIDAGSRANSVNTIKNYIDQYCKDGVLEYVIVTHADRDHIAGFASSNSIFDIYKCETIIDFPLTDKTSDTYFDYVSKRDKEVLSDGATHYTALECVKEQNGAKKVYNLASNITMEILYQKYYEQRSEYENNYSVCTLFTHGDRSFLLTGDLEEDGEKSLVANNSLPEVAFFKAGHHGSKTSSNDVLLDVIKPKLCVVTCSVGYNEYGAEPENVFPTQKFIDRIAKHTDKVYAPIIGDPDYTGGKDYLLLNGDIKIQSKETKVTVICSNNATLLKDTDWFKANRQMPAVWNF